MTGLAHSSGEDDSGGSDSEDDEFGEICDDGCLGTDMFNRGDNGANDLGPRPMSPTKYSNHDQQQQPGTPSRSEEPEVAGASTQKPRIIVVAATNRPEG